MVGFNLTLRYSFTVPQSRRLMYLMIIVLSLCLAMDAATSGSNEFAVTWYTIDGGGGYSSDVNFIVQGIVGQADTAVIAGEDFTVRGGFWPKNDFTDINAGIFRDDFETLPLPSR